MPPIVGAATRCMISDLAPIMWGQGAGSAMMAITSNAALSTFP